MKQVHKTSVLVAAVVVAVLGIGFFLVTDVFVNSAGTPYVPPTEQNTVTFDTDALYYVSVADELVYESFDQSLTLESAQTHCDTIAYSPDYMWQQVICVYQGQEIYNDIFVAG